jgi:hypothetical protein
VAFWLFSNFHVMTVFMMNRLTASTIFWLASAFAAPTTAPTVAPWTERVTPVVSVSLLSVVAVFSGSIFCYHSICRTLAVAAPQPPPPSSAGGRTMNEVWAEEEAVAAERGLENWVVALLTMGD